MTRWEKIKNHDTHTHTILNNNDPTEKKKELKTNKKYKNLIVWCGSGMVEPGRQFVNVWARDRLLGFVLFLFYCIIIKICVFSVCVCVFYFLLLIWLLGRLSSRTQKFLATIVASSAVKKKHRTAGWRRRKKPPANGKVVSFFFTHTWRKIESELSFV